MTTPTMAAPDMSEDRAERDRMSVSSNRRMDAGVLRGSQRMKVTIVPVIETGMPGR